MRKFLDTFDTRGREDGIVSIIWILFLIFFIYINKYLHFKITRDEFINYYSSVSGKVIIEDVNQMLILFKFKVKTFYIKT